MRPPQSSSQPLSIRFVSIAILITFAFVLPFHAHAATQQLRCSPSSLRFGSVTLGQTESQLVVLTNTGQTSVAVSAISVTNAEFTVSGLKLPAVLPAGQSVTFNVVFTPTETGWTTPQTVTFSSSPNPDLQFTVKGTGVAADLLSVTPSSLSFGPVAVGSSVKLSEVVTNSSSKSRTLTAIQTVGTGFSTSGPALPFVLPAGQSVKLGISFSPQSAGVTGGSVFLTGLNLNVPLTGTGTSTTVGQLIIAPTALNFGSVDVGTTTTQPSSMSATGGVVTVSSANTSNAQFSISGISFPLTISVGQTVPFDVAFSPTKSGASSGTLTVASNASDSQATESVTGAGVLPQHSVNLSWNSSTSPVTGYNVYRGATVGAYTKINSALDPNTVYTDSTVVSGTTYYYAATAVDSGGRESAYSTPVQVAIP